MSDAATSRLRDWGAELAIILGSGLGSLVENIPLEAQLDYARFPDLPTPVVSGHAGRFLLGTLNGVRIIYAQGRVHLYEGHSPRAVTAIVRMLAACGIKRLILTNAAGTANPDFHPGSWMMIADQLNLTGTSPLLGMPQFIDMTEAYSPTWRARFAQAGAAARLPLHDGVYVGLLGPQYETPAEVRMLRQLGADAIGMSTVLETIQARALGLEVAGFSCLTNWAAGMSAQTLSHEEVLATSQAAAKDFSRLLSIQGI